MAEYDPELIDSIRTAREQYPSLRQAMQPEGEFTPEYMRPELMGGFGTPVVGALLQMIDRTGLTPDQLDRNPEMTKALFKKAYTENPEMLAEQKDRTPPSEKAQRRWSAEDINSVMIKYNNWRKRETGQDLTPQERVTEGFIDVRNPNSMF